MNTAKLRQVLNENPDLTLDVFEQHKQECRPTVLTLAWHVVAVKSGRVVAPPKRKRHGNG